MAHTSVRRFRKVVSGQGWTPQCGEFGGIRGDLPDPLMRNLISVLPNLSRELEGDSASDTTTSTPTETETTGQPGFGVLAAVGGILSAVALLRRLLADDSP